MAQDVAKCLKPNQKAMYYNSFVKESPSLSPLDYLWISLIALTFTLHLSKELGQVLLCNITFEKVFISSYRYLMTIKRGKQTLVHISL